MLFRDRGATPSVGRDGGSIVTGALLLIVAGAAWWATIQRASSMAGSSAMSSGAMASGGPASDWWPGALAFLAGWGVMMAAMMLPSATPLIALFGRMQRPTQRAVGRAVGTALFTAVYLAVWLAFGAPTYLFGLALQQVAATWPAAATAWPGGVAAVLFLAGLYQFTPWKQACLRACRSPLGFLLGHWRPGLLGAVRLGLSHALYCLGCCWGLMLVLVLAGAMGLTWALLIAALVLVEKVIPYGSWSARGAGAALVALGVLVAVRPELATMLRGAGM